MSESGRSDRAPWALLRWLTVAQLLGCSSAARVAQTAYQTAGPAFEAPAPARDAGSSGAQAAGRGASGGAGAPEPAAVSCSASLAERLRITQIDVSRDVRYKSPGYMAFPFDERVSFAPASDGTAYVAWLDDATGGVRVTPLAADFTRRAADLDTRSWEIGGIAAREDGFALLSLRDDPGEALVNRMGHSDSFGRAVFLLRYRLGQETFAVPLTGTRSITSKADPAARDFAPGYVYGRLQWNGAKYGAYFTIFTAQADPHGATDTPSDKLVYVDDYGGALRGGWSWKCASSQGLRLWPEPDVFTPVCMSDGVPNPGANLVIEDQPPLQLGAEASARGYCGGQWGSIVKLADKSYLIGWLSREVAAGNPMLPARRASDVALQRLNSDRQPLGKKRWLIETPSVGEVNLHFARYGASSVLMVWDRMDNLRCGDADQVCFGHYAGTFARVIDAEGNTLIPDTQISAVPNSHDDLQTLSDGSVAWAYVADEARDYMPIPVDGNGNLRVPAKRRISVARLRHCD